MAAAALFLFGIGTARADTVAYHTVITFIQGPAGSSGVGTNTLTLANGDVLVATGLTVGSGVSPDAPLVGTPGITGGLGDIRASGPGATIGSATSGPNSIRIQIDVYQDYTTPPTSPPGPGQILPPGSFIGSAFGTLFQTPGPLDSFDSATLTFDAPFTFILPNPPTTVQESVAYTIDPVQQIRLSASNNHLNDISVNITAVPLPSTATTGLTLIAGLSAFGGLIKLRRWLIAPGLPV